MTSQLLTEIQNTCSQLVTNNSRKVATNVVHADDSRPSNTGKRSLYGSLLISHIQYHATTHPNFHHNPNPNPAPSTK